MAGSQLPAVIDALVSTWKAAGLKTWDGPVVNEDFSPAIFVGYDGGEDQSDYTSATGRSDWGPIGTRARNEDLSVVCAAVALGTSDNPQSARNAAFALYNAADNAIRRGGDPSLGLTGTAQFMVAGCRFERLYTEPTEDQGYLCRVVFSVDVKTRI